MKEYGAKPKVYDEDFQKKKRKKDKKKRKQLGEVAEGPTLVERYRNMQTKGNVNNSALKTLGDLAAGLLVGPLLSAAFGKAAPLAGAALTFGGHYIGDDTSMIRIAGMSAVAHSVAKAKEYRQPGITFRDRMVGVKDDLLYTLLIKRYDAEEKKVPVQEESVAEPVHGIDANAEHFEGIEEPDYPEPMTYRSHREEPRPQPERNEVDGMEPEAYNPWNDPMLGFYLDDQPDFTKF